MSEKCIFCRIIDGSLPASFIYSDDLCVSFMDIQPVNPGHILVIPRDHTALIGDLKDDICEHLFRTGVKISGGLRKTNVKCEGINFFLADGEAAGQDVFHTHLHIIPRYKDDGFGFRFPPDYSVRPARHTLDKVADEIRETLQDSF